MPLGKFNGRVSKILCGALLDDLMPYYKLILLVVKSFSRETENILPTICKYCIQAENYKHLSHDCSLILSFDVVKQILAHLTGAKIHSDILRRIFFTDKDILIDPYLSKYVFGTFYRRLHSTKFNKEVIINNNAYHF